MKRIILSDVDINNRKFKQIASSSDITFSAPSVDGPINEDRLVVDINHLVSLYPGEVPTNLDISSVSVFKGFSNPDELKYVLTLTLADTISADTSAVLRYLDIGPKFVCLNFEKENIADSRADIKYAINYLLSSNADSQVELPELTFENSDIGDQIDEVLDSVCEKLSIWIQPNTQGGVGNWEFYNNSDEYLGEVDFQHAVSMLQHLYNSSTTKSGFVRKMTNWLKSTIS